MAKKLRIPEDSYNPILFFLEYEEKPEEIARFSVTKKALDRMVKDRDLERNGNGIYFLKKQKIRYQVSASQKGYYVKWIRMPGKSFKFPGKASAVKGRKVIIDY